LPAAGDDEPKVFPTTPPNYIDLTRVEGHEVISHNVARLPGQVEEVMRTVTYYSPKLHMPDDMLGTWYPMNLWRSLRDLPPEAVLKRGTEEIGGERLLRFEVVKVQDVPEVQPRTRIWVNPKTRQPVIMEEPNGMSPRRWTDVRFNASIPESTFDFPPLPEDIDASTTWGFHLPYATWNQPGFSFRVLDPDGKPIITEKDIETRSMSVPHGPGAAGDEPSYEGGQAYLLEAGIDKLDRFLARHPGETMTIQITGEPALKRQAFGRMARGPFIGAYGSPVYFLLMSEASIKANTQPTQPTQPGQPGAPGMWRPGAVDPNGPEGGAAPGFRGAPTRAGRAF
jgi:hypothetical protein